jgi:Rab3 GTPase-activating protein catalytic subunit
MEDSVLDDITNNVEYYVDVDPCEGDAMDKNKNECAVNPSNSAPTLDSDAPSQDKKLSRSRRSPRQSDGDVCAKQMKFKHPSSAKWSRARSQTRNITDSTPVFQQEYKVDYSCSSPLERLARDVGNTLRQWRVHQGCDWHVSLDWAEKMDDLDGEEELQELASNLDDEVLVDSKEENSCQDTRKAVDPPIQCMSMDICEKGFANRARTIHSWMGDESTILPSRSNILLKKPQSQSPTSSSKQKQRASFAPPKNSRSTQTGKVATKESYHRGARCIRSQKISFHTTGYSPEQINGSVNWNRRQYTIPLLLKFWDAPFSPVNERGDIFVRHGAERVPRSLQPSISSSTFSLTGELGILSPCGTDRRYYNSPSTLHSTNTKDDFSIFGTFGSQTDMATGLTRDISSLFDIGQHITLCLDHSEISIDKGHQDIESFYNDLYFCIENNINEAIERQRLQMHERRRRAKQRDLQLLKRNHTKIEENRRRKTQQDQHETDDNVTLNDYSFERDGVSEFDSSESEDSYDVYTLDDSDLHLEQHEIHAEVAASLTALLQTALNLAASENDCSIPVFGIWGDYFGDSVEAITRERMHSKAASWISSRLERNLLQIRDSAIVGQRKDDTESSMKLLFSSPVLSGMCLSGIFQSTHRLYYIPTKVLPLHLSTLNGLAKVLLTQCPSSDDAVVLSAARHRYHWEQRDDNERHDRESILCNQEWRVANPASTGDDSSPIEMYRERCQQHALLILRRASSPLVYRPEPMWGPSEGNPLVSLSASVTWGVIAVQEDTSIIPPTLLKLPLRIRSSNFASTPSELLDVEYALQSAALNPIGMGVVEREGGHHEFGPQEPIFLANAEFDIDAPCATLSANTRCVLAALLRCGSLGSDTLPGHLTKRNIIVQMAGDSTGAETNTEEVLHKSLSLAKIGPVTKRIIDALEWGDIKMDVSEADFDRATNEALQRIQSTTYPAPPAEVFSIGNSKLHSKNHQLQSQSKGSPPGRLLSILFAHMARLRTPPSMMRLWLSFVEELRTRWDNNESLPNLGIVPGLDSAGDAAKPRSGLQKVDTRVLGHRASHAAFVNSSEPDPDRDHCIINQMLQVYNICIECKMSMESLHDKRNSTHDGEINDSMESGGTLSGNHSSEDDDEFFDPDDEVIFSYGSPDTKQKNSDIERMLLQATITAPSHNRIGARCPVPDALPLGSSGDQVNSQRFFS